MASSRSAGAARRSPTFESGYFVRTYKGAGGDAKRARFDGSVGYDSDNYYKRQRIWLTSDALRQNFHEKGIFLRELTRN